MQPPVFWSDDEAWGHLRAQTEALGRPQAVEEALACAVFALCGASPPAREAMRCYAEAKLARAPLGRCDAAEVLTWALACHDALLHTVEDAQATPALLAEFTAALAWCVARAVREDATIRTGLICCESRAFSGRYLSVRCGDEGPHSLAEHDTWRRDVLWCEVAASKPGVLPPAQLDRVEAWACGALWRGLMPADDHDEDEEALWA